jgi:hypothetical protein
VSDTLFTRLSERAFSSGINEIVERKIMPMPSIVDNPRPLIMSTHLLHLNYIRIL